MSLYQVTFWRLNVAPSSIKLGDTVHTQPSQLGHSVNVHANSEAEALESATRMTQGLVFDRTVAPTVSLLKEQREPVISVEWHDATGQHCSTCETVVKDGHIAEISSSLPFSLFLCSDCIHELKQKLS